jgi:hypothetical protein
MVSVKFITNFILHINLIQYPIGILLHGRCKNNQFVILSHFPQKLYCVRSYIELAIVTKLFKMNLSLIQI